MSNPTWKTIDLFTSGRAVEAALQDPVTAVAGREPNSIRRTSHLDVMRPNGVAGDLAIAGGGRDLQTAASGRGTCVHEGSIRLEVGAPQLDVRSAEADGFAGAVHELTGVGVFSGFRRALSAAAKDSDIGSLGYALLDDVPVATIVSSYAPLSVGLVTDTDRDSFAGRIGVCQGWKPGGTVETSLGRTGTVPVHAGPAAPWLFDVPGDALAWHLHEPLTAGSVRRLRCMDVTLDGESLRIEAMFRDTHAAADGHEQVIHEYRLRARVEALSLRLLEISAEPKVLPYPECPLAAQSAPRLVGGSLKGLRRRVAKEFSGTSTCTHLNDMLRSLGDVPYLSRLLLR